MTPPTQATYHWLKQIPTSLLQLDEIPLLGFPPPFPWDQFNQKLSELLELPSLKITPASAPEWREGSDLLAGLGDNIIPLSISVAPTGGTVYWVMSKEDLDSMMALLLTQQKQPAEMIDEDYELPFYRFLALETINTISSLDFDKALSFHILNENKISSEAALCLDISIELYEKTIWGRLILSNEFRQRWKERYATRSNEIPLAKKVNLSIHLEIGKVSLTPKEWSGIQTGDFVILDSCTLNDQGEGLVNLTVHGLPLFSGKLAQNGIQLIEYVEQQIEEPTMANDRDDEHEIDEDEENNASEEESFADEDENEEDLEAEDDEDLESEDDEELEDEDLDEDDEEVEDEELDEEFSLKQERWPPPPEKRIEPKKESRRQEPAAQPSHVQISEEEHPADEAISLTDTPLSIVVEAGRLQMSLQKLIELQPGNLLDLNIHPENGVDLVLNGKKIAKGELLLIGESLGVRILDIG